MKYCLSYNKGSHYLKDCEEINFYYDRRESALIDFLEAHSNQRVNLILLDKNLADFIESKDIRKLNAIYKTHSNFALRLGEEERALGLKYEYFSILAEAQIPVYFAHIITTWDQLQYYLSRKVSDVIIGEDLCFEMKDVAQLVHNNNAQVRVFPNVAQASAKDSNDNKKFFIRPEDISTYEPYVDVCEFWGDVRRQDWYYKIYAIKKRWLTKIDWIIVGAHIGLPNKMILTPTFGQARLNCGKRCLKGGNCKTCDSIISINRHLGEAAKKFHNN